MTEAWLPPTVGSAKLENGAAKETEEEVEKLER